MDIFNANPLLVRQPKRYFTDVSDYEVFDPHGRPIARVKEQGADGGMQVLRFMAKNTGGFARLVHVDDMHGHTRLVIQKHWSWMTASTSVNLPDGRPVGSIEQDFKFFGSRFTLMDPWKRPVGSIEGDFIGYDFRIKDHAEHEVARVDRKLPDLGEIFTAADSYALHHRYPSLPEPLRTLVIASSIAIDLVLREGK
ncbi:MULTISPECIES: LURP-one-related/scramblase family protein [Nocardiopsis]|uniref:Scramblase n=2 Tax=Nocardiopsis alba TaxID=53437 RepID=A0A7K2IQX2_9ACTN|nr:MULTISPECIES: phospholipid scramblase-related protein [Nocardiopsis]AFR06992.1 scramblase family protein [Nocardiopsis alba ATCC BAA-2165]MEC3892709.1 phospholipid scramblase-related protein [Nocardiopsis sp. LDBS1602]MYR32368.1 scramblase [Nocardiopsis alba]